MKDGIKNRCERDIRYAECNAAYNRCSKEQKG